MCTMLIPVSPAPAAPNKEVIIAIPVAEPRAAAPPAPSTAPAPTATKGAASPPVTPGKDAKINIHQVKDFTGKLSLQKEKSTFFMIKCVLVIISWLAGPLGAFIEGTRCLQCLFVVESAIITNHSSSAHSGQSNEEVTS